jgi:hypothetical protein
MNNLFKDALYRCISEEENTNDDHLCMISKVPLTRENKITLYCGHSFAYNALLEEVKQQKRKMYNTNCFGRDKLKRNEVKCPYCRGVQKGLLPQKGNEELKYINFPPKWTMYTHKCTNVFLSGKRKGEKCEKLSKEKYCLTCKKQIQLRNSKTKCPIIIKSGKRKGEQCRNYCKSNEGTCGIHINRLKKTLSE